MVCRDHRHCSVPVDTLGAMSANTTTSQILTGALLAATLLLSGCAGPNRAAPVVVLNSQHYPKELANETEYTVQAGDTLYAIAWYTGNDYMDIAQWNSLAQPYNIYPGQQLSLVPPKVVVKKTSTVKKLTGTTTKQKTKKSIDQKDSQAYCDCESDVNNSKGIDRKPVIKGFPDRVEEWIWPSSGRIELSNNSGSGTNSGLDIYAKKGSDIVAAAAGKVVYAGNALRGYGNLIIIKHTESFLSAYAHNDQILVKERDWISAGQLIAKMGDTGTSSVRLHFEIRYRGKAVEPMKYLPNKNNNK